MTATCMRPCNLSAVEIEAIAAAIAAETGLHDGTRSLEKTIEALGGRVYFKDFWRENAISLVVRELDDFEIYIQRENNEAGRRVDMAHELGHYVLHYMRPALAGEMDGPAEFSRYDMNDADIEATKFMVGLLMPADLFRMSWSQVRAGEDRNFGLLRLAEALDVPPGHAFFRAAALGLAKRC